MTLDEAIWYFQGSAFKTGTKLCDAWTVIYAHLTTPPEIPVSAVEAVVLLSITNGDPVMQVMEGWDRLPKGNYLLHVKPGLPVGFRARLMGLIAESWVHGKSEAELGEAADALVASFHATPPPTAGFRVVPDAIRPGWINDQVYLDEKYAHGWNDCRKTILAAHDAGGV
jgi:hypothetical protein